MFVGLDVWHGDPRRKYSVGAVVFSLNVDMSMVHSCVRNHKFKQEIFDDIREEFVIALRRFQQVSVYVSFEKYYVKRKETIRFVHRRMDAFRNAYWSTETV